MKNICFIGAFDKLDLMLYTSKVIKELGYKVLIVDATSMQKARYIVPTINPTKSYITRFEDIDIAIGFNSYDEIERYIGFTEDQKMKYDYILVNVDDAPKFENFNNESTLKNYLTTILTIFPGTTISLISVFPLTASAIFSSAFARESISSLPAATGILITERTLPFI